MAEIASAHEAKVRANVDLPPDLVRRAERFVNNGDDTALSELITTALEHFVLHLEAQVAGQPESTAESLAWTQLSQDAFAEDWDSEEDAIYDDWEKHYGLRQG